MNTPIKNPILPPVECYVEVEVDGKRLYQEIQTSKIEPRVMLKPETETAKPEVHSKKGLFSSLRSLWKQNNN